MVTQLTLDALERAFADPEPLAPRKAKNAACSFVTGTGLTIDDLSQEIRDVIYDFFTRNPAVISLVVNDPMNRHHQSPSKRGKWEILAFREGGLQDAKDVISMQRSSAKLSVESILRNILKGWTV